MHNYVSYSYTWFLGRLKTYHLLFYFIFIMDFQKCIRRGPWPLVDPSFFAATIFLKKNKASTPSSESRIKGAGYKIQSLKSLQRKTNCTWCLTLIKRVKTTHKPCARSVLWKHHPPRLSWELLDHSGRLVRTSGVSVDVMCLCWPRQKKTWCFSEPVPSVCHCSCLKKCKYVQ